MDRNKKWEVAEEWRSATWEGATREAMRRWAELPLEQLVAAQEEMWDLAAAFNDSPQANEFASKVISRKIP